MVVCLERGAHLHMAQLVPLPLTISCFIKIHMPLLMATSILGLGRCHSSSPQQCYLCVCVCVWAGVCDASSQHERSISPATLRHRRPAGRLCQRRDKDVSVSGQCRRRPAASRARVQCREPPYLLAASSTAVSALTHIPGLRWLCCFQVLVSWLALASLPVYKLSFSMGTFGTLYYCYYCEL